MIRTLQRLAPLLILIAAFLLTQQMWKLRLWLNPVHVEVPEGVVELYGTSWCGYCANARRFFDANGIPFADLDIERSPAAEQAFQQLGGRGVPLIRVGDEIIHGFSPDDLRRALRQFEENREAEALPASPAGSTL